MTLFLLLKYIHIVAAIVMVGISLANGLGKLFGDRTGNVHRMATVTTLTVYFIMSIGLAESPEIRRRAGGRRSQGNIGA